MLASTLGELRNSPFGDPSLRTRTIKDEMRANLLRQLEAREPLFSGVHGYEETVLPQIVNALLARHNFILLGLRGQAKTRILRSMPPDALDRQAVLVKPGNEEVARTVNQFVSGITTHVRHHLSIVEEKRLALGLPPLPQS